MREDDINSELDNILRLANREMVSWGYCKDSFIDTIFYKAGDVVSLHKYLRILSDYGFVIIRGGGCQRIFNVYDYR